MLTKITRYKTQDRRRSAFHSYRKKIKSALLALARNVILCNTPEGVDAAAALARVISREGMTNRNYLLFLVLMETNNPFVIDVLLDGRNPFVLFAPIKPNWFLIRETFRILAKYKASELTENALRALLGVVQNAYKTSKYGYKIYPLNMSDVYNIGKYLDKGKDQNDDRNRLLLEILYDIYFVGIDSEDRNTIQVGIKANDIRMAFFDNTKRMVDAIPHVLLVQDLERPPIEPRRFLWKEQIPPVVAPPRLSAPKAAKPKASAPTAKPSSIAKAKASGKREKSVTIGAKSKKARKRV